MFFVASSAAVAHRQRQARRREEQRSAAEPEKPHDNDIVDISYVGGNIPSRSFKMLQTMTGEPNESSEYITVGLRPFAKQARPCQGT